MRILVLGGTSFIGRAIVEEALRQGHRPTVFNRGVTGTELFPQVPRIIGDREKNDYAALAGGEWDAVVDTTAYRPADVRAALAALPDSFDRYLLISSQAVYDENAAGSTEDVPRRDPLPDADVLDEDTYGRLKVACEDTLTASLADRASIVRPGRVVGPHDNQAAFPYWVRRAARGGRVVWPGDTGQPVQVLDVRDLACLAIHLLNDDREGAFNAVGPAKPVTIGELLTACAQAAGSHIDIVTVPEEEAPPLFPLFRRSSLWTTQRRDASPAYIAGLTATPLADTIADVLAWDRQRGEPPLDRGFTAAEEEELLRRYG